MNTKQFTGQSLAAVEFEDLNKLLQYSLMYPFDVWKDGNVLYLLDDDRGIRLDATKVKQLVQRIWNGETFELKRPGENEIVGELSMDRLQRRFPRGQYYYEKWLESNDGGFADIAFRLLFEYSIHKGTSRDR